MSWMPEVQTAGDGDTWTSNSLRFATKEEAEANVRDLMSRWMAVTAVRVTESDEPVNYAWVDGRLVEVKSE